MSMQTAQTKKRKHEFFMVDLLLPQNYQEETGKTGRLILKERIDKLVAVE
jgi:hypothetical protein